MATSVVPQHALWVWKEYIWRYSLKWGRKLL